ncbi:MULTISPECIES: helix-turn-helix domain-containing protein [unclassified Mesorhizobium]|uniref:helix-turn-helix domain-containing protein n=1 Tax=unclassified Mesorhizobium TaxID=325217 RepID=UPI001CC9D6CC|nr:MULTISPECIES: helix-turn-helix transcriptional regulator [unclassified Mesorhizobium]MBZ9740628.1 helix-turn-helix domain-containing protein [Mesorhizobium sp. CO1-1-4]MBZ9775987.1 helix-turn-helix domain-containing protein [Mesorhizobium sp. CO1-1-8]
MRLRSVFARNLRLLRQATSLSQEQLADLAGLDRNYVGKLEREENAPTLDTLEVLALALQIDVEILIRRSLRRHSTMPPEDQ